jgi:hypothetical protein
MSISRLGVARVRDARVVAVVKSHSRLMKREGILDDRKINNIKSFSNVISPSSLLARHEEPLQE